MAKNKGIFMCNDCHVEFQIIVEPDKDEETIMHEYLDSFNAEVQYCPFCMSENVVCEDEDDDFNLQGDGGGF